MLMTEEEKLLCKNLKDCADRLVSANIYKILPEIGTNIGYTISGTSVAEVCDIPGRIRRVDKDCCYVRSPRMGGSLYMASTLLAIRKKFPDAECVANFRSSPEIIDACETLNFNVVPMPPIPDFWQLGDAYDKDLAKTIRSAKTLPDIITIPDRINLEKLILVVGISIEDFQEKVLALNTMVGRSATAVRKKSEREKVEHEFEPVFDECSEVLMLGTMPSPKSRENGFYYGHPQNRFWKVMATVLGEAAPETILQKTAMLKKHHVALWDVLESCTIVGASDTSIEDAVPNDIAALVAKTKITRIFCTGATSYKFYKKYCEESVGIPAVKLPSTSPANCAVSMEKLVLAYRQILTK